MPSSGSTEIVSRERTGPIDPKEGPEQESAPARLSEAERAAAFRRTEPKVPRKFAVIVVAVLVVLALGGTVLEHLLSSVGLNPDSAIAGQSTATTSPTGVIAPPRSTPATPQVNAPLRELMGITPLAGTAPGFSLSDQAGHPVSLDDEHGKVVVLTFFDAPCQDICPVVSAELLRAAEALGPAASHVVFLTVNTDPVVLSPAPASAAAVRTGLGTLATWHFLSSDLRTLNTVWRDYGVSVNISRTSGLVAHNDVMDFIDPSGRLRYQATPFADESSSGAFSLPPLSIDRWGQGIATYVRQLLGNTA
jgi:protein SCO1/2